MSGQLRASAVLRGDLSWSPSTHMVDNNSLELQIQSIQGSLLTSTGTRFICDT